MFSNLFDYSYKRTGKQALGFYIAYLVLVIVVSMFVGGFLEVGYVGNESAAYASGLRVGTMLVSLVSFGLSLIILHEKKMLNNFGMILLAIFAGILGLFGGGLLGLIPAAYLTTK